MISPSVLSHCGQTVMILSHADKLQQSVHNETSGRCAMKQVFRLQNSLLLAGFTRPVSNVSQSKGHICERRDRHNYLATFATNAE